MLRARDLLQCQKRPIRVSKETYYSVKRDLSPDVASKITDDVDSVRLVCTPDIFAESVPQQRV
jgi:hypothetical protein